jgi:ATP-dependent RNA helicase RhlE
MSFEEFKLNRLIRRNLSVMGYRDPRPIQAQAIELLMEGRDLIGLAPTGTGKTAAFLCPIAHSLLESPLADGKRKTNPQRRLRALVLCPTRELAVQVEEECRHIIAGTALRSACAYGKVGMKSQREAIASGIDLLIATPGRVRELLDADALTLAHIRHVAIDEADRMLDMGFLPQVAAILDSIPAERQMMLLTATMPRPVEELAQRFLNAPVRIEVGRHTTPVDHVEQHLALVAQREKVEWLVSVLPRLGGTASGKLEVPIAAKRAGIAPSILIFCRTRRRVGWVGSALQRHGIACGMIHGDRTQAQRLRAIENLSSGKLHVIVSTDVAARGLHIPAVKTVINYDVPPNAEEYVHRIGRAAHGGGRKGSAWTLLAEVDRERWAAISTRLALQLDPEQVDGTETAQPAASGHGTDRSGAMLQKSRHGKFVGQAAARIGNDRSGKQTKRTAKRQPRSRKARPIPKNQKPGAGVIRRRRD